MTEQWFAFTAYNSQAHYGFGTEQDADKYSNILNRNREVNHYHYHALSTEESRGLESGDDTDGFELALAIETQAEHDEFNAAKQPMPPQNAQ